METHPSDKIKSFWKTKKKKKKKKLQQQGRKKFNTRVCCLYKLSVGKYFSWGGGLKFKECKQARSFSSESKKVFCEFLLCHLGTFIYSVEGNFNTNDQESPREKRVFSLLARFCLFF